MPRVTLEPITVDNWKACAALSVRADQQAFVPSPLYSIAEAQFYPDARCFAVCAEGGQIVGFAQYGRDVFTGHWKIFRVMVDQTHQGQGYGRAATELLIADISRQPDSGDILICYHDANHAARHLYATLGFIEQSIDADGKVTACRLKEI